MNTLEWRAEDWHSGTDSEDGADAVFFGYLSISINTVRRECAKGGWRDSKNEVKGLRRRIVIAR